ncbi:MAG TPA: glycoside hydrolase family 97 catalytic domain-containing protein [Chitinophagaceae bacterium]|nr:glycoside hydrolase family 97 catalytic domain-containing protein [Chitinophagaceae bacterium]
MRIKILILFFVISPLVIIARQSDWNITLPSPDRKLELNFMMGADSVLNYTFTADGKLLLKPSPIGPDIKGGLLLKNKYTRSVSDTWTPVWAKRSVVPDRYNEIVLEFNLYTLIARVYNDGIAFRYEKLSTEKELTAFHFAGNFTAWYYKVEDHNIGPEKLNDADGERMPVMTVKADSMRYMAIHEAALESGEPLRLTTQKGSALFTVPSKKSRAWRVILFGRSPGALVDSHLIELLNPKPAAGSDFSWVRPGVAVWDWRINGAVADGFRYDMSLPSWKRMVDFASANGMKSLVLDADWYGPEFNKESDPLKGGKVEQVKQIIAYGKERNVGVWLYLNDVAGKEFPLAQILKQYGEWGAAGIKYGFMRGNYEEKNIHTRQITELCAEYHLMVDFHDNPVHPYGQMRTWPNAVTREYNHAQSDAHRVFQPKTFVTAVFVNMIAGPLDMNNGAMDMIQQGRVDNPMPIPSTITAEAARTLIVFSGATIIPDIPENYNKHPQILKFIAAERMPWKESKTLSGEIGEYIVMARQASDGNWLIGAATNEKARTLKIPLDFLGGSAFQAMIIQDGADADFRTKKESYQVSQKVVKRTDMITVKLAPGGGACILLFSK